MPLALTAGGALAALAALLRPPLAPPSMEEADEIIGPVWQVSALAKHLKEYEFQIPGVVAADAPGETSTNAAGDWYPTPHGLLLGKAEQRPILWPPLPRCAQLPSYLTPSMVRTRR